MMPLAYNLGDPRSSGFYAAYSGNYLPTFRDNLSVQDLLTLEYVADWLCGNVGTELLFISRRKPEITYNLAN
jgi:hypothetical protein